MKENSLGQAQAFRIERCIFLRYQDSLHISVLRVSCIASFGNHDLSAIPVKGSGMMFSNGASGQHLIALAHADLASHS